MTRNDIVWADLGPPAGRRPVCVLTRDAAISVLTALTCAPITRTIRGIRSEVELGHGHGLPERCAITCDNVITVPLGDLDAEPVGHLDEITRARSDLCQAGTVVSVRRGRRPPQRDRRRRRWRGTI